MFQLLLLSPHFSAIVCFPDGILYSGQNDLPASENVQMAVHVFVVQLSGIFLSDISLSQSLPMYVFVMSHKTTATASS